MMGKSTKSAKTNPWGDNHPEKLSDTPPKTIGLNAQLKGLFDPDSFFRPTGSETRREPFLPERKEPARKTNEILLFSYEAKKEEQKIHQETTIILQKLKEQVVILEKSNKELVSGMSKVKLEKAPKKTGIYYIRFLEWMLTVVRQMRLKVEEGQAWLETFTKRKKKLGYWKMYKKHGTTFGLSHERTLATQTG